MKFSDIITENQLHEKPTGFLNKIGTNIASAFGSNKATSNLAVTGRVEFLRKKFNNYITASGQQPTADSLLAFLKQTGYPTQSAEKLVNKDTQTTTDQQPATNTSVPTTQQQLKKQAGTDKSDTDSYERYKGQVRQLQNQTTDKNLPPNTISKIEADIAKLAKGDKESGNFAAKKIMTFANAGYNVGDLAAKWSANSKAGERFLTQSVFIAISKMLQEHGLYWQDIGIKLRLDEGVNQVVYISYLNEDEVLSKDVIDNVLTAAVQDAFKSGMLKIGADGKVTVGSSPAAANSAAPAQTNVKVTNFDKAKELADKLTPSEKQELVNYIKGD